MQAPDPAPPAPPEPLAESAPQPADAPAPAARGAAAPPPRRWAVGLLSLLHAPVFAWAALALPFRPWTLFAVVTAALALLHAATAALSLAPHPLAPRAFRVTSFVSLGYLAFLSYGLLSSAVYVASLNRGLGAGIAAALLAVWGVVALLTLPFACWGVASTGGLPRLRRRSSPRAARATLAALSALAVLAALALLLRHRTAKADVLPVPGGAPSGTGAALREALSSFEALPAPPARAPSLMTTAPAACDAPPEPGRPTLVVTHLARGKEPERAAVATRCLQPPPGEDAAAALSAALADALRGSLKIDVVAAVQPLGSPGPGLVGLSLRPGLDGVCLAGRCLMPWQLIALDAFNTNAPLAGVPDFRFGVDLATLRRALGEPEPPGGAAGADERALRSGLLRIETLSYTVDSAGALHLLSRIGEPGVELTEATVQRAADAARRYILGAQRKDGMFRYIVDPFTGRASFDGFSIARQAGTTLALCELGAGAEGAPAPKELRTTVQRSLALLAKLERRAGDGGAVGALFYPADSRGTVANLNPTALSLVAFLSCRDALGEKREARAAHDPLIGRLARMVLATQRDDGGFAPQLDLARVAPVLGPTQLYEGGQSVLALSLLEDLAAREPGPELPPAAEVRAAVDRAMGYYANRYWDHFASDFVYMEENWHCLAARAALGRHRRDDYERFCLDYVAFKSRLVLDEESGVAPDLVGGYGFGNVLPPHNTATAGFGEALAAAMAVKAARGEDLGRERALMERVLRFLVRQQWSPATCFACSRDVVIEGGFSESMASPRIRIDYVQHAWAALGHGGRMLGLLPGQSAPQAGPL
ncbi:hypothetical protein [Sorangium sp. So ce1335]|uniref:hypothetical protein n=1 Tax=Sorangium sp. So ce1335 TaxID=3133335 RepID=UPI003F5D65E9